MATKTSRKHGSQQSVNSAVKGICNIMRRSDCAGALQYVPELTWILFLRILDEREEHEAEEAAALGLAFTPTMQAPYRWQDWADPHSPRRRGEGEYRGFSAWDFVHDELLPHLHGLKKQLGATPRQKVVSEIMARVKESAIDTEKNFLDVLATNRGSPRRRGGKRRGNDNRLEQAYYRSGYSLVSHPSTAERREAFRGFPPP
jgi:type I restriction enzyme M protein